MTETYDFLLGEMSKSMPLVDITVLAQAGCCRRSDVNTRKLRFPSALVHSHHTRWYVQKTYLQETSQPDSFLCLDELHLLRVSVQLVQRISATIFIQVALDQAKSFAEIPGISCSRIAPRDRSCTLTSPYTTIPNGPTRPK